MNGPWRCPEWRRRAGRLVAWVWIIVASVAIGWVVQNERGESARLRAALAAEQARQADEDRREDAARCGKWKAEAEADVPVATRNIGRVVVRTAAASYVLDPRCVELLGELDPIDPDALIADPNPEPDPDPPN